MTMPRWERPYDSPKQAFQATQESCIAERGDTCEAYGGVDCKECLKYQDGLKRRKTRRDLEEKQTIARVKIGEKIMRLRKTIDFRHLEIGRDWEKPPIFVLERSITLTAIEMSYLKNLLWRLP